MDNSDRIDEVFDKHIKYEFEKEDPDATMTTMI